jgi:CTP:phosphocholine cytidylyltransferase-like protein
VLLVALICTSRYKAVMICLTTYMLPLPPRTFQSLPLFHVTSLALLTTYRHKTFHYYADKFGVVCIQNIRYVGKTFYSVACAFHSGFVYVCLRYPSGFEVDVSWEDF